MVPIDLKLGLLFRNIRLSLMKGHLEALCLILQVSHGVGNAAADDDDDSKYTKPIVY